MDKHKFLSEVKKVDRQAYINLKQISHIAALDQEYADRIRYAETYRFTDIPSIIITGIFKWDETLEGDDYWWRVYGKLVEDYK